MKKLTATLTVLALVLTLSATAYAIAPSAARQLNNTQPQSGAVMTPPYNTVDQITHDRGNIVTTIDNYGYIGGYWAYDLPSGEWPRNSGHHYIGELMYWMGAVTADGDTLVADPYDDFQGMPSEIDGQSVYKILLSSDTTRYYHYDRTDSAAAGVGQPALGWRVWDPRNQVWGYNAVYDQLASSFDSTAGPTSLQDSHYRFNDGALGSPLLGLEVTHTMYQWNYCYNEDFVFVVVDITNRSTEDFAEFAFGLYVDIDVGGPDGTGENGRLSDLIDYDTAENLAWTYDFDGYDEGWRSETGIMGTKLLQTPDDIGMTSIRNQDWALLPDDDVGRFEFINSNQFDTPLDTTDQFYMQCVRGINLTAGKTVRVVYALIAGEDEADFFDNAATAQLLYDNNFIGPEPPPTPSLTARAGDRKTYLSWNKLAEQGTDPMSGDNDFRGYKLYRSDDQGKTWGKIDYNTGNDCLTIDYDPLATWTVNAAGDPTAHSFIDTGLYNGVEYWYCLAAFDAGDTVAGIDVLQSGFGVAGGAPNIIAATPRDNPLGYVAADATVEHTNLAMGGLSDGAIVPEVLDRTATTGDRYEVRFSDTPVKTVWHLINTETGDTVLADQQTYGGDPNLYEIAEGLRVYVEEGDPVPRALTQTSFSGADTTLLVGEFYGHALVALTGDPTWVTGNQPLRDNYEIRFTGDSSRAAYMMDLYTGVDVPYWVDLEIWNVTRNERVSVGVWDSDDDGVWEGADGEPIAVIDVAYDPAQWVTPLAFPYFYSWMFEFDTDGFNPSTGDVFTIEGAPLNGPNDVFSFRLGAVDAGAVGPNLDSIRVVPNPYFARYSSMVETEPGESVMEFQNLPDRCTVRIYTLAGDLVNTLENDDGDGVVRWDLLSNNRQQIASGIYYYYVESPYGNHMGRFAVVK